MLNQDRYGLSLWLQDGIIGSMGQRIIAGITIACLLFLVVMLGMTTPQSVGLIGVFGVFIAGYVSLVGAVTFLLYYGSRYGKRLVFWRQRRPVVDLSLSRAYLYGLVLALVPMIIISLHSTGGGLAWYEVLLTLLFGAVSIFYVMRR